MTKQPLTDIETMRRIVGRERATVDQANELNELLTGHEVMKDALTDVRDRGEIDFTELRDLIDALRSAIDAGVPVVQEDDLNAAEEAVALIEGVFTIDTESAGEFVDQYEAAEGAIESYVDVKESDRYEGKGDDVADRWAEVQEAIESFVGAAETLGVG